MLWLEGTIVSTPLFSLLLLSWCRVDWFVSCVDDNQLPPISTQVDDRRQ